MSCLRPTLAHQWSVRAVECGGEEESPLSASCCGPLGGWALPPSFASDFGKTTTAGQNVATSVTRPPPTSTHSFDTKITLAGTCNSHISGIFASVILLWFIFLILFLSVCVSTCSGKEILAAELALHCSYAEHFGQRCLCMFILCIECKTRINTTDRYRLSICETAHALCLTVFCSTSR